MRMILTTTVMAALSLPGHIWGGRRGGEGCL